MLEGLRNRFRPGSKGEAVSRVDTTGQRMSQAAAEVRVRGEITETVGVNWPVGVMGLPAPKEGQQPDPEAAPYGRYAADDSRILKRLFGLDVPDL